MRFTRKSGNSPIVASTTFDDCCDVAGAAHGSARTPAASARRRATPGEAVDRHVGRGRGTSPDRPVGGPASVRTVGVGDRDDRRVGAGEVRQMPNGVRGHMMGVHPHWAGSLRITGTDDGGGVQRRAGEGRYRVGQDGIGEHHDTALETPGCRVADAGAGHRRELQRELVRWLGTGDRPPNEPGTTGSPGAGGSGRPRHRPPALDIASRHSRKTRISGNKQRIAIAPSGRPFALGRLVCKRPHPPPRAARASGRDADSGTATRCPPPTGRNHPVVPISRGSAPTARLRLGWRRPGRQRGQRFGPAVPGAPHVDTPLSVPRRPLTDLRRVPRRG